MAVSVHDESTTQDQIVALVFAARTPKARAGWHPATIACARLMLQILVLANLLASGAHFAHNAVMLDSYPGPSWIPGPWFVVVAWCVVAATLVLFAYFVTVARHETRDCATMH